jgi:hypothetical protein
VQILPFESGGFPLLWAIGVRLRKAGPVLEHLVLGTMDGPLISLSREKVELFCLKELFAYRRSGFLCGSLRV